MLRISATWSFHSNIIIIIFIINSFDLDNKSMQFMYIAENSFL